MNYTDVLKLKLDISDTEDLGRAKRAYAEKHMEPSMSARAIVDEPTTVGRPLPIIECPLCSLDVGYRTSSGNVMTFCLDVHQCLALSDVPLLTEYEQATLCGSCKGSNGGCSGFAPRFNTFSRMHSCLTVVVLQIDYIWSIMYATPRDGWLTRRIIKQMVYTDRLTQNYCVRILNKLKSAGYTTIGLGNCVGCHPFQCTVVRGMPCSKPDRRSFSMEAVGVDCDALHMRLYGEQLPWYFQGTGKLPVYMARYIGVFGDHVDISKLVMEAAMTDKSYVSMASVPEHREYTIQLQRIPRRINAGLYQYVLNDPGGLV